MNGIRVKSNLLPACIEDRLKYNPEIIELHLEEKILRQPEPLIETIRFLKNKGIEIYLHQPSKYNRLYLDILSVDPVMKAHYRSSSEILGRICEEEDVRCVIHAHYARTESSGHTDIPRSRAMREAIERIRSLPGGRRFLWEDTIEGLFSYANPHLIDEIVKPLQLDLNVDTSHAFIALKGSNSKLQDVLERTRPYAKYFHVVDSMGLSHDSLPLGKGRIDWKMAKPYLANKPYIFEIGLKEPHDDCTPMVESAAYLEKI